MKILLVHYRYFISGGPERYMFNLMESLEHQGHEVIPFSIKTSKNIKSKFSDYFAENIGKSDEIFVHKYPKNVRTYIDLIYREFYSWSVKKKIKKIIKATDPDICYLLVYKRALSPSVIDACYECNLPIVNRISDYNPVCGAASLYNKGNFCTKCFDDNDKSCVIEKCIKGSFVYSFMRYFSIKLSSLLKFDNKIQTYVCTNGFMKEMMQKRGYKENKLHIIPTFFHEKPQYKSIDKSNSVSNVVHLLYIGNIDESKGIYDLIDALKIVHEKYSCFHLSIVGGLHKEENERVLQLIKEKNLVDHITFYPFKNDGDVFQHYLNCNITVLPARWSENLPNTLIESIYFNRPVIVPKWGSFKYTADDSIAYYFQPLSSYSLAKTIEQILLNNETILEKSKACRVFFERNFSEDKHIEQLLHLFKSLIKDRKQ